VASASRGFSEDISAAAEIDLDEHACATGWAVFCAAMTAPMQEPEHRLALIRHGRSSHEHPGWMDASGFRTWREHYEAAGIVAGERVPAAVQQLASSADRVVCSDAQRAVASAQLVAPDREVVASPLLRELDLQGPFLGALRLPLIAWAVAVGGRAALLRLGGKYPSVAEAQRIENAAAWLDELAAQHVTVVAVTHASFRRLVARRLVEIGWHAEPGPRSMRHWSVWGFRRGRRI
jgi:broad specificity phosphatase PhoE